MSLVNVKYSLSTDSTYIKILIKKKKEAAKQILGGEKLKNVHEAHHFFFFFCLNCQIWVNFDTFYVILGKLGKK